MAMLFLFSPHRLLPHRLNGQLELRFVFFHAIYQSLHAF